MKQSNARVRHTQAVLVNFQSQGAVWAAQWSGPSRTCKRQNQYAQRSNHRRVYSALVCQPYNSIAQGFNPPAHTAQGPICVGVYGAGASTTCWGNLYWPGRG